MTPARRLHSVPGTGTGLPNLHPSMEARTLRPARKPTLYDHTTEAHQPAAPSMVLQALSLLVRHAQQPGSVPPDPLRDAVEIATAHFLARPAPHGSGR